jgi:signal transduction histidine kinase
MAVVLLFVLIFGHHVNDVLTHSLAIRYENADLIGELRARTRTAQDARAAAEAANLAKSQLLAAASHDLRQPLHALGLYVAALAAGARSAWRDLVGSVQAAAEALDREFEQLLDLSRLEAGALVPEVADVALAPLFARLTAEFAPQAAARGVSLTVVPTRLAIRTDPQLYARIARNLLVNAIRYTREGGIVVGARRCGEGVRVDVVDTGCGIAREHLAHIFDEFYQVTTEGAGARAAGGMGLGLAIVRRFATLLGHPIAVASEAGRGSRFSVTAPRRSGGESLRARTASAACAAREHARRRAPPGDRRRSRRRRGDLAPVHDGRAPRWPAAATRVRPSPRRRAHISLIVADLHLENGACGIAAVLRLRAELDLAIPALIVSGDTAASAHRRVRDAGLALLPKPVSAAALAAAAAALVAGTPKPLPV